MCIEFNRALLSGAKSVKSKIHLNSRNIPPLFNNETSQGGLSGLDNA